MGAKLVTMIIVASPNFFQGGASLHALIQEHSLNTIAYRQRARDQGKPIEWEEGVQDLYLNDTNSARCLLQSDV